MNHRRPENIILSKWAEEEQRTELHRREKGEVILLMKTEGHWGTERR